MTNPIAAEFPEINPANYNDEDVRALNAWGILAHDEIERLTRECDDKFGPRDAERQARWGTTVAQKDAEIARLQNHLISVKQARLDWAMVCECTCAACETFSNVIRLIGRGAVEPTPAERPSRPEAPPCDHPKARLHIDGSGQHWCGACGIAVRPGEQP